MKPATEGAHALMRDGAIALAAVEAAGIRIDVTYLKNTTEKIGNRIKRLESKLREQPEYAEQRKQFGQNTLLGSRVQLARVLYNIQGHTPTAYTSGGKRGDRRPQLDNAALDAIGTPYTRNFIKLEKLKKLKGTYLNGVLREVADDGFLRAFYNLHIPITYRGSSDSPNFQNIPTRDPEIAKYIRRAFIPRPGHVLVECDLKANEVRVAVCYHKDPTMVQYILDDYDLHAEMAGECYLLNKDEVTKKIRYQAKGNFVFAEFYGSYYVDVAKSLWDSIVTEHLELPDGQPLDEHLFSKGITGRGACVAGERQDAQPGTFEYHIQQIEKRFWGERFPVYDRWRHDWWAEYCRKGWFQMLTGFVVQGVYKRNEVINSPVQGAAFHCLLWGLIRIVRELRKKKMKTVVVGQIHDSIIADVHESELQDYLAMVRRVLVVDIRKAWGWLLVPLGVEAEVGVENWWEKKEVELPV